MPLKLTKPLGARAEADAFSGPRTKGPISFPAVGGRRKDIGLTLPTRGTLRRFAGREHPPGHRVRRDQRPPR
jgi:hypothetical protein